LVCRTCRKARGLARCGRVVYNELHKGRSHLQPWFARVLGWPRMPSPCSFRWRDIALSRARLLSSRVRASTLARTWRPANDSARKTQEVHQLTVLGGIHGTFLMLILKDWLWAHNLCAAFEARGPMGWGVLPSCSTSARLRVSSISRLSAATSFDTLALRLASKSNSFWRRASAAFSCRTTLSCARLRRAYRCVCETPVQ